MATTETTLCRMRTDRRHAVRWMGYASAALCLTFALSVNAAPGNGSRGDGKGTQGPADSTQAQAQMPGQEQGQMPGKMQGRNGKCTPDTPTDQAVVGKSLADAESMLQGCPWRIGMQDGKIMPTTRDYRPDRRTLTIENGKVTSVTRG
ncbi:hypothetical protein PCO31110_03671 [Pandoraea communis]|uniref:Peptidase inhibitor I78 family protein n=1 Tax=Pandoraea communis TaxID=2508297 RepID=A0A5E4X308_9BURK|nr:hypothetical protein [Pandoraea communis]VVE30710.1 hypothetical protein PCO31110_03671 [Pandoraea communis]